MTHRCSWITFTFIIDSISTPLLRATRLTFNVPEHRFDYELSLSKPILDVEVIFVIPYMTTTFQPQLYTLRTWSNFALGSHRCGNVSREPVCLDVRKWEIFPCRGESSPWPYEGIAASGEGGGGGRRLLLFLLLIEKLCTS